jgi:WD40 repeat protein
VFDTSAPAQPVHLLTQAGTIEPEAIAPDGSVVYVLDHRPTYYRVRSLVVAGGELYDTIGRDKSEPAEDMHGEPVRAVASPDGSLLSTLYRLPSPTAGATPFVHVLDLAHGWSYCADLPPGDYDRIATSPDGRTLVVGATDGAWITVDLTDIGTPGDVPLPLAVHQGGTPPVPLAVGGSAVAGAVTVTVDAGGVAWHTGTAPTGTIASVAWPSGRPNPQLAALLAA